MEWGFVNRAWEKWASNNVGSSGEPLTAALLVNYDPAAPSRSLATIFLSYFLQRPTLEGVYRSAEKEGIKGDPMELRELVNFVKRNNFQRETLVIGINQYLVTSIHENWLCARCMNTSKPAGEGVVIMHKASFLMVALYDGSIGAASHAVAALDQFAWQLDRRNV